MTRRNSLIRFKGAALIAITSFFGTCVQIFGAVSRWSWKGYPNEADLRHHLKSSDNHPYITNEEVDQMTFEECIAYHETDHERRKDKPRWSEARQVPGTKRGATPSLSSVETVDNRP